MKKVLSFCVLCVFLLVLCVGVKAQTPGCCVSITPPNMPTMNAGEQYEFYFQPNLSCVSADEMVSIEWEVWRDGVLIPNRQLTTYFSQFAFQAYVPEAGGMWIGNTYTNRYCNDGDGVGSFPGALTPIQGEGTACERKGTFMYGPDNYFDFFYARYMTHNYATPETANGNVRLVITPKDNAQYEIVVSYYTRLGGTNYDAQIVPGNEQANNYIGGHQSTLGTLILTDTLSPIKAIVGEDQIICDGAAFSAGYPSVDFTTTGTYTANYYSHAFVAGTSCNAAIDSTVTFRLTVISLDEPELDINASTLQVCDEGDVTLVATPSVAYNPTVCAWFDNAGTELFKGNTFNTHVDATTDFVVRSYNPLYGCYSLTGTPVTVHVYNSPAPVIDPASVNVVCENEEVRLNLQTIIPSTSIKWYFNDVEIPGETTGTLVIANAQLANAGTYKVTVSEEHVNPYNPAASIICTGEATIDVTVNARPVITFTEFNGEALATPGSAITLTEDVCPLGDNEIVAQVTEGTAPYTYAWTGTASQVDNGATSTAVVDNTVCGTAHNITLTVTDANGCAVATPATFNYNGADNVDPVVTLTQTEVAAIPAGACQYQVPNVLAYASATDNCQVQAFVQNPAAGTIITTTQNVQVTATDLCGNTTTEEIIVKVSPMQLTTTVVNVACPGTDPNTGSLTVAIADGHPNFTLTLTNVTTGVADLPVNDVTASYTYTNLAAADYRVDVVDQNGCAASINATIAAPEVLGFAAAPVVTDASCSGDADGSIQFEVAGGVAPYAVTVVGGALDTAINGTTINANIQNLNAGTYVVTVTDSNACVFTQNITVAQPDALELTLTANNPLCFGAANGTANVVVTGGTAPYNYEWKDATDAVIGSLDNIAGLAAGSYTLVVKDANDCEATQQFTLVDPAQMQFHTLNLSPDHCPYAPNYEFSVLIENAPAQVIYKWTVDGAVQRNQNSTINNDTLRFVPAPDCKHTYNFVLEVQDPNGCQIDTTFQFEVADSIAPTHTGVLPEKHVYSCSVTDAPTPYTTAAQFNADGVTFFDACTTQDELVITSSADTLISACPFRINRTYYVADKCGNVDTVNQVIYVQDTVKPKVRIDGNILADGQWLNDTIVYASADCNPNLPAPRFYTVDAFLATKAFGVDSILSCTMGGTYPIQLLVDPTIVDASDPATGIVYHATITMVDLCNNTSRFYAKVKVKDNIPPAVTNLTDNVYSTYASGTGCNNNVPDAFTTVGAVNARAANAITDCNVEETTTVTLTLTVTRPGCIDTLVRTYEVVDAAGNPNTFTHTFYIYDTVKPVLSVTTLVDTLFETNACGVIDAQLDNLKARFTSVANIQAAYSNFTAGDCKDMTVDYLSVDTVVTTTLPANPARTYTYHYEVRDICGNKTALDHIVRVRDTIKPVVVNPIPAETILSTGANCSPARPKFTDVAALEAYYTAKASTFEVTECHFDRNSLQCIDSAVNSANPCQVVYTYTYTVKDSAGNESVPFTHTITVKDEEAPVLVAAALPASTIYQTANCDPYHAALAATRIAELDALNNGTPVVTAECHLDSAVTYTQVVVPGIGALQQKEIINREYTISDLCGRESKLSHTIYVLDTVRPVLVNGTTVVNALPKDTIYGALGTCFPVGTIFTEVQDITAKYSECRIKDCSVKDDTPVTLVRFTEGGNSCDSIVTRYYTVTDTCTNTSFEFSHTTVLIDTTRPAVVGTLTDLTVYTNATDCDFTAPTAYANVAEMVAANAGFSVTDCNGIKVEYRDADTTDVACSNRQFIRTYILTDSCGNVATINQTIKVVDNVAPVFDATLPTEVAAQGIGLCTFEVPDLKDTVMAHVSDNCRPDAELTFVQTPEAGTAMLADQDVTVQVFDRCEVGGVVVYNNPSVVRTISVKIPAAPSITLVEDTAAKCYGTATASLKVKFTAATAVTVKVENDPYNVSLSDQELDANVAAGVDSVVFTGLYAGTASVTVTDANGCTATRTSVDIHQHPEITATLSEITGNDCGGQELKVEVVPAGGVKPYNISWTVSEAAIEVATRDTNAVRKDTITYRIPVDHSAHEYAFAVTVVDSNGCQKGDFATVITTHPAYDFYDTARVCITNLPYDWMHEGVLVKTLDATDITADNTIYTFDETFTTAHGCDSTFTLRLEVSSKPYLVGRVASATAAVDGADLRENEVHYTTSTDTTTKLEIFVRKNCSNCNTMISLELNSYLVDTATNVATPISNVNTYTDLTLATNMDMHYTTPQPINAATVSIPGIYTSFQGVSEKFNYYNLCFADPNYDCSPVVIPQSIVAAPYYGPNYNNAGAPNLGRVTLMSFNAWRQPGRYKFEVVLAERENGNIYTAQGFCPNDGKMGGNNANLSSVYFDTLTFYVEVEQGTAPLPMVNPFESDVDIVTTSSSQADIYLYPNPARDAFNVELTGFEGKTTILIANADGRIMQKQDVVVDAFTSNIYTINTADLTQGIYTVTVRSSQNVVTKRIVVIR